MPEPRLQGLTVGLLTRPPSVGDGRRPSESLIGEQWVEGLERRGARVVKTAIPDPEANTWPLFFHEALASHRETFPSRADEYSDNVRAKLELALEVDPVEVAAAYNAVEAWRRYEPDVDLYVAPCLAIDVPEEDCDEYAVRVALHRLAPPGQPARLGRPGDREPAADRSDRRDGSRCRPRLGARLARLAALELRLALLAERLHALAKVPGGAQHPVGEAFELEAGMERPLLGEVQDALRRREHER